MVESLAFAEAHADPSRPLGFLLGAALILIVLFGLCAIFSCCYQWEMIRSPSHSFSGHSVASGAADGHSSFSMSNFDSKGSMQYKSQSLPVTMPGDRIPKFIALPCPREPSVSEKTIEISKWGTILHNQAYQ